MLIYILAESALETIPKSLWTHPIIKRYSEECRKGPQFILLDRSYHHGAMKKLSQNRKRGRPDIVHFSLLETLSSPLNKEGKLQVYVHTINNYVIAVEPNTRLPRNYNRFVGLVEQLFELGNVPPTGQVLLKLGCKTLARLLQDVKPTYVVAFSRIGMPNTLEDTLSKLSCEERLAVIVGGFPNGHLSKTTVKLANEVICIDSEMLDACTVTSRVMYEYERTISLPKKRLNVHDL